MYYENGRLVVAVTDEAAARAVRSEGGVAKVVARSAAELKTVHGNLDQLGNVPNTTWGVEASTNQVNVEIFDGAPADARARIEKIAAAHPGAVRIDRVNSELVFKDKLLGRFGIVSNGWLCSTGFNARNSAGAEYVLTAGHCVPGTGNVWSVNWNGERIGVQNAYAYGSGTSGACDGSSRGCDWASIRVDSGALQPVGGVQYFDGTIRDITGSRYAMENEDSDRLGTSSEDTTGHITKTHVTVNMAGKTLYGMYETNHCALGGDSGGPLFHGTIALGLLSGGTDETTCNSSATGTYRNYFTKVQTVLNERGLHVY
ncbi:S1 family peptidase [Streptomyces sp. NPDC058052]|uniref:S1 family peptidase n=1 Tax=Streptomyces sp. NPDC058052 TaxID=3346316 RepID=UPI0036EDD869